jgi:hypothetical protein
MWAMERIAVLYDLRKLNKKDWYQWGAEIPGRQSGVGRKLGGGRVPRPAPGVEHRSGGIVPPPRQPDPRPVAPADRGRRGADREGGQAGTEPPPKAEPPAPTPSRQAAGAEEGGPRAPPPARTRSNRRARPSSAREEDPVLLIALAVLLAALLGGGCRVLAVKKRRSEARTSRKGEAEEESQEGSKAESRTSSGAIGGGAATVREGAEHRVTLGAPPRSRPLERATQNEPPASGEGERAPDAGGVRGRPGTDAGSFQSPDRGRGRVKWAMGEGEYRQTPAGRTKTARMSLPVGWAKLATVVPSLIALPVPCLLQPHRISLKPYSW